MGDGHFPPPRRCSLQLQGQKTLDSRWCIWEDRRAAAILPFIFVSSLAQNCQLFTLRKLRKKTVEFWGESQKDKENTDAVDWPANSLRQAFLKGGYGTQVWVTHFA